MLELAQPGVPAKFIAHEMPADFVQGLQDDIAGMAEVTQLDAIMNNKYARHPEKLRARSSAERLKSNNIKETDETFSGEFQGVLPKGRSFEFKLRDQDGILRGKVGSEIPDADVLNREFLHKLAQVEFHVIQVGQGKPRYTLLALDKIR